jgi:hypothetical protein
MADGEPGSVHGTLADVSLLDLLQVFGVTERSGLLVVEHADERLSLTLRQGRVVTAQLSPPRHHLAGYFLRNGWIDFETLHEALRRQGASEHRRRIGEILVEMGALTREQLAAGLEHQVRGVLADVLDWTFGLFHLVEEPADALSTPDLVGVRYGIEDLARLAGRDASGQRAATDVPAIPSAAPAGDASWLARARLAIVFTDDILVRHGLELRLRSIGCAVFGLGALEEIGPMLLASEDPEPTLIVDLDLVAGNRTQALRTFHRLRRLRRQWPNLRLVTFGRSVPDTFFPFLLRSKVLFHVPRASAAAESDIRLVQDFVEVLARQIDDEVALPSQDGRRSPSSRVPPRRG